MGRTRREDQRAATLNEIKALAWQHIDEVGPADLSLREISRRMRMSSAAIYRYFPNREALLTALSHDAFAAQAAALEAAVAASPAGGPDRLRAMAGAYRAWALTYPGRYALIFGTTIPGYRHDWDALQSVVGRGLDLLVQVLAQAEARHDVAEDSLPPDLRAQLAAVNAARGYPVPPEALYAAIAAWIRLHGLVSLELLGHFDRLADADTLFRVEVEALIVAVGVSEGGRA